MNSTTESPAPVDAKPASESDKKPETTEQPKGEPLPKLVECFKAFSKFGDPTGDGRLTLSQSDKWMKQAGVIDGKTITTTDTGIYFKSFKMQKMPCATYVQFLEKLSKAKNVDVAQMKIKLRSCGEPGLKGTTAVVKSSAVERLADTPKKKEDTTKPKPSPRTVKSPSH